LANWILYKHAAEGIQFVYDSLHESKQKSILQEVVTRYAIVLKSHSLVRTIVKGNDRPNGGELAYHLTTIMMLANSKESVEQCFDWQLLTYLVNTIQWRYDPKTRRHSTRNSSKDYYAIEDAGTYSYQAGHQSRGSLNSLDCTATFTFPLVIWSGQGSQQVRLSLLYTRF
jgi:hypothetical protein